MPNFTMTALDTIGVQNYLFRSNRLRENIGASYLVEQATGDWLQHVLPTPNNLTSEGKINPALHLESDENLQAEIIYRGGGNALILSRTPDLARMIVRLLSRKLLKLAPGLEITAEHCSFEWQHQAIGGDEGIYNTLLAHLNHRKQQRRISVTLPGQSVTLACRSTGFPAVPVDSADVGEEDTQNPISAEIYAKVQQANLDAADRRLLELLPPEARHTYKISRDLDHLGRSAGENSYIAIVHADGNNIGKRFKSVITRFSDSSENRQCLDTLRDLSQAVERAGRTALERTLALLLTRSEQSEELQAFMDKVVHQKQSSERPFFPVRPIVFGGDDVTFVCDGRLGLTLATHYLQEFEAATSTLPEGGQAYACAGIAVVKSHYPFYNAYALSEELCKNAKRAVRQAEMTGSALDWHFAASGLAGSLGEIRMREYTTRSGGHLEMRPVTLLPPGLDGWRSWETFRSSIEGFKHPDWQERRNKLIALRDALRAETETTQRYLTKYAINELPSLGKTIDQTSPAFRKQGWTADRCGYFDAIEALDFYIPLTPNS